MNALRLFLPVSPDAWQERARESPGEPCLATAADDLRRALLAALRFERGFQAFAISGNYEEKQIYLSKARKLPGWTPQARPREVAAP